MENQHRQIKGYRELTPAEIALMNAFKAHEAKWNGLIDQLDSMIGIDKRQLAIAKTEGESSYMRAVRAIAQPARIVEMPKDVLNSHELPVAQQTER